MTITIQPSPQILSSGWGKMEVESLGWGKDFKLWPGGGRGWDWTEHGTNHSSGVQLGDVDELLLHGCKIIILTTGCLGRLKVSWDVVGALEIQDIDKVIVITTKKGIQLYNEYAAQGIAVGGLFHSTC